MIKKKSVEWFSLLEAVVLFANYTQLLANVEMHVMVYTPDKIESITWVVLKLVNFCWNMEVITNFESESFTFN